MSGLNRNIGKRLSDVGYLDKLIIDILTVLVVIFMSINNYRHERHKRLLQFTLLSSKRKGGACRYKKNSYPGFSHLTQVNRLSPQVEYLSFVN